MILSTWTIHLLSSCSENSLYFYSALQVWGKYSGQNRLSWQWPHKGELVVRCRWGAISCLLSSFRPWLLWSICAMDQHPSLVFPQVWGKVFCGVSNWKKKPYHGTVTRCKRSDSRFLLEWLRLVSASSTTLCVLTEQREGRFPSSYLCYAALFFGGYLQNQRTEMCKWTLTHSSSCWTRITHSGMEPRRKQPRSIVSCRVLFTGAWRKNNSRKR